MTAFGFGADRFGWTDDALAEVRRLRGWTEAAIERLELTYDEGAGVVGIPIRDELADELGRLTYNPRPNRANGRPKMTSPAGVPRQLFPPPELVPDTARDVLLVEGEPDAVAAWSAGFVAVGVPGTAGWQARYAARFRGPRWRVSVVFDCDEPGRRAAAAVAESLLEYGVDVHVVDLDPRRDDGYDLTDYLLEREPGELRELMAAAPLYSTEPAVAPIVFEPLRVFLERALPPAESLVGVARGGTNLLPRFGWVMPWGREGSGKTSVVVDLLFHAAAGVAWLGHYPIERPLRLVVVVNEGVPGGFQDKLAAKVEAWDAGAVEAVLDNLAVYASPWGEFTFRDARMANHARAFAQDFGADYVALDPLHTLGTIGGGKPEETESFKHVLRAFGVWTDLGVITAHHSNKAGMVSGDWARHPDTVFRLEKDGQNPATKLTLEKARPADPAELGVPTLLEWEVDTLGYRRVAIEATPRVSDAEVLEKVLAVLGEASGPLGMTELQAAAGGTKERVRAAVLAELERGETGQIRNLSTRPRYYSLVIAETPSGDSGDSSPYGAQTQLNTEERIAETAPAIPLDEGNSPTGADRIAESPGGYVVPPGDESAIQSPVGDENEDEPWTF
jgi:hypothetical protein